MISRGNDPDLDQAVASFAQYVDISDYGADNVLEWAMSIHNPQYKKETVTAIMTKLNEIAPEQAIQLSSTLGDEFENIIQDLKNSPARPSTDEEAL